MTDANPDPTPAAPPKRKKGPFRTGLLVVLITTVAILFLVVQFFSGDFLRWALTSQAVASSGARIEIGKASASLIGGSVELHDLEVAPYADSKDSVLTAKNAVAKLDVGEAVSGFFHIPEMTLSEGTINLVRDRNGRLNIDPGPTPDEAEKPKEEEAKDRDLVQEVKSIIDRYQKYHDYYEKVHKQKTKDEQERQAKEKQRLFPGKASYLPEIVELSPRFWLKKLGAQNLALRSLDERTGKPFLPEMESLSLVVENLSSNAQLVNEPLSVKIDAKPKGAGQWQIRFAHPSGESALNEIGFALDQVDVAEAAKLVSKSLPFDFEGGTFSLRSITPPAAHDAQGSKVRAEDGTVRLDLEQVAGAIKLDLSKVKLKAAPGRDSILGIPTPTFLQAFNYAAEQAPISLMFGVSGNTSLPKFDLLNGGDVLTTLRDQVANSTNAQLQALKDQLTSGLQDALKNQQDALLDQGKALLKGKAKPKDVKEQLQNTLKNPKLSDQLKDAKDQLGGIFGGKKDKDKDKDKKKDDGGEKKDGGG